ncbi:MAG TPA: GFA family protein [Casimicrobiaceae bacterium]|nr:GFA family protein [Casimicrobiaceae bacterium]
MTTKLAERQAAERDSTSRTWTGSCFCGTVRFTVSGEPAAMGYCHCESCRSWAAAPVNAFTLWKPEQVRVTQGEAEIGHYSKTPKSDRKWCRQCGGHVFTAHPHWNLIDVYAAAIPDFPYRAGVHVNYQETRLRLRDGLPKMKDLPKEMGGSGVTVGE